MPPKDRLSLAYRNVVTVAGAAVLLMSAYRVIVDRVGYQWAILLFLTLLTGLMTVRIRRLSSRFSVSDVFIYINMILFGTAAGVLTASLDGLLGSLRLDTPTRRRRAAPFNTAVLALSVHVAGVVFFSVFARPPLSLGGSSSVIDLAAPIALSTLAYYACNSALVATIVALQKGASPLTVWSEGLGATFGVTMAGTVAGGVIAHSICYVTPLMLLAVVPVMVAACALNKLSLRTEAAGLGSQPPDCHSR